MNGQDDNNYITEWDWNEPFLPDYDPYRTFKEVKALQKRKVILQDLIEQAERERSNK